uniref:Zinc knuckle family protein n=3 Tax=Oryza sativa TaxID=4530 RepID=Q8W2W0_ORYSJ|nr:putative polyprotein [Oryza sativa Japonica Group]AAL79353.1 Putative polyprotein [Oryza sativa]AAP53282.1 Zinc knuckle family protein [Oryza sativa Japonica Group]
MSHLEGTGGLDDKGDASSTKDTGPKGATIHFDYGKLNVPPHNFVSVPSGRVPQFDGTHYAAWKHKMKLHLISLHPSIWKVVCTEEFNKVDGLEEAKEIWERRPRRYGILCNWLMRDHPPFRLLRAFGPRNPTLVLMIRERKDFKRLTPSDILGRIVCHEMQEEEAREVRQMVKNATMIKNQEVVLKAKQEEESSYEESEDEEMAFIVKRFKHFLRKSGYGKGRKEDDKGKRQSKRACFNCGKYGHFIADCPKSNEAKVKGGKKKPERAHVAEAHMAEESLAKECAKNEQLANELNLANGSLASLRDVNETLQDKFANLDKSHKDLEVQFDTLSNSTYQPNVVSNPSNPSTSNGCARCYNIDLNSYDTNVDAMQALKKENERLGTLMKYGCMKTYHSKDALYKTITAHPNKDGHGLRFSGGSPVSKRVMVNGKECLMFVREGKAPQASEVTCPFTGQTPGSSGQNDRKFLPCKTGSFKHFVRKFRASDRQKGLTGSSGYNTRKFRPEDLYYDSYVISKNSEGKMVAYFNGNYNDEYRTCVGVPKALAYSSGGSSWVVDSGCTNYMMGERSMFTSLDEEGGSRENIVFGDNGKGKVMGLGFNCLFTDVDMTVFKRDDSSIALKGVLKGDLYLVDFDVDRVNPEACLIAKSSMRWLWHRRLAHVGMRNLASLLKGEHIIGLSNVSFEKDRV